MVTIINSWKCNKFRDFLILTWWGEDMPEVICGAVVWFWDTLQILNISFFTLRISNYVFNSIKMTKSKRKNSNPHNISFFSKIIIATDVLFHTNSKKVGLNFSKLWNIFFWFFLCIPSGKWVVGTTSDNRRPTWLAAHFWKLIDKISLKSTLLQILSITNIESIIFIYTSKFCEIISDVF